MKLLGVLLCYNDGDLLQDALEYLLSQNHDVIVWDHGSTDSTPDVLRRMRPHLLEHARVPRDFDFYELYPAMSRHLIERYISQYDWISWPDQDEFLEGPVRAKPYFESVREAAECGGDWIEFHNQNYWFTAVDDPAVQSPVERIRHYSIFPDCAPRIRSWRASSTNIRIFNHNAPEGKGWPQRFHLRHYPMRSHAQALRRLDHDRAGLRRGTSNFHYDKMAECRERLHIAPESLHYDDGMSDLSLVPVFNWRTIYGYPS